MIKGPQTLQIGDLAKAMEVPEARVLEIAADTSAHYFEEELRLIKGKLRPIEVPHVWLMTSLAKLQRFLQRVFPSHPDVHGGIRKRSCFTAARNHLGKNFILQRDIQDCYPSISAAMILEALLHRGVQQDVARILACLLTTRDRIPQGSPISGVALNIFFHRFDQRLASYCGRHHISYTRTYDDIVVSVNRHDLVEVVSDRLDREIERVGLRINESKKRKRGLQSRNRPQRIHGLQVNSRRGIRIPKETANRVVSWAEEYQRGSRTASVSDLPSLLDKRRRLVGYACHFGQTHLGPARILRALIDDADRRISLRLQQEGVIWAGSSWGKLARRGRAGRIVERWVERRNPHAPIGSDPAPP